MIIEKKKLSELKPAPYNPRQSTAKQEKQLKASLEKFGVVEPIIYNKQTGYIVGGHFRVRELTKLGYKEVECVIVDLNEEDERELNIRLNANTGEWDWDSLANEWDVEKLDDWGLDLPVDLSVQEELEAEEDEFDVPEGGIETDIVLGDLFEIGEHRLLCGDSTDIEKVELLMNGQEVNLLTDPPYGINANKQTLGTGKKQFHRGDNWDVEVPDFYYILALVNKAIIWGGNYFADKLPINNDWLCWHKKNDGLSFSEFELAWTNLDKNCRMLSHHWGGEKKEHPTMKPLKLMEWCINYLDDKPILDIFCGSGSTMVASHQLKRKCYGMELDPKYCQVIIDRMKKLDPSLVIKKNGVEIK
jgi:DNA modification methylase